ncbi:hypothetical protein Tco_0855153 [Tanacetum coccineum]
MPLRKRARFTTPDSRFEVGESSADAVASRRPPAKGVGLCVADSHTGNHPEDDFTPLKTIRRSYSVIRERIPFELEWETFKPERGAILNVQAQVLFALNATLRFTRS